MKLYKVTKNISDEQQCYIDDTRYLADPHDNYSIRRSVHNLIALQNEYWKRPLIQIQKEYI